MQPFTYLVPALFFNKPLGHDTFGAALGLFEFESATLYSEPEFIASVTSGVNFATTNENAGVSNPDFRGTVVPNDGAAPFQMKMSGVQLGNDVVLPIISGNTPTGIEVPYGTVYRVLTPTFRGGESKYKSLENTVFVASETVSDSGIPGKFLLGVKISKVFASKTNITIGEEFSG
ncbi:putative lipase gdsl protein [Botrytis fragariae]|uniref:Putative lipase gdsl protein n=1 Tax=Botrytis fragariae TaxID=1964551 RepID=A0A8H6AW24_9HELO|nr:putative lipase gdsl protein [Botrytis fragariae]KAF5874779.1 putative lipase gdsl protein [Botrytis fragariae]